MTGGVRARTSDGKTLTCDTLRYNDATGRLLGEGNVVLTSPLGEQLRGQRLDADVRLSKLVMTGASGAP
jgi:lipopolysaccharide assembly outer membrane protein LptD (OstA)